MNSNDNINIHIKPLAQRALLAKLTTRKPNLVKKDADAEKQLQADTGDLAFSVNKTLFRDPLNPIRKLMNSVNAVYLHHKKWTLPYADRGPRLLPIEGYENYRDTMRRLAQEVEVEIAQVMPQYDMWVQQDINYRNSCAMDPSKRRASVADYPSAEDFEAAVGTEVRFMPLPDSAHFLFDIKEEDKASLHLQLQEAADKARADLYDRVRAPVVKLLEKLKVSIGEQGAIFRDTAVTNIMEELAMARELAMGDEKVLAMVEEVSAVINRRGLDKRPDMLRESPIVREETRVALAAVEQKMAFMFGG